MIPCMQAFSRRSTYVSTTFCCTLCAMKKYYIVSVSLTSRDNAVEVQIEAANGAGEVVEFCGGLVAILKAAGIDLKAAHQQNGMPLSETAEPITVSSLYFDLKCYEDLKARLSNRKRLGISLVDPDGPIPEPTLAAIRHVPFDAISACLPLERPLFYCLVAMLYCIPTVWDLFLNPSSKAACGHRTISLCDLWCSIVVDQYFRYTCGLVGLCQQVWVVQERSCGRGGSQVPDHPRSTAKGSDGVPEGRHQIWAAKTGEGADCRRDGHRKDGAGHCSRLLLPGVYPLHRGLAG